jgi:nucleolar protein 4
MFLLLPPSRQHVSKLTDYFNSNSTSIFANNTEQRTSSSSSESKLFIRSLADIVDTSLQRKKCRLIIRNLSFQATEQNIIDKLGKFGPIFEVSIPKVEVTRKIDNPDSDPDGNTKKRTRKMISLDEPKLQPRGFGFITYLCEKDAKNVVEGSVGLKICNREIALDFCASKEAYTKMMHHKLTDPIESSTLDDKKGNIEDSEENETPTTDPEESIEDGDDGDNDDGDDDGDEDDSEDQKSKKSKILTSDTQEMKTVFLR